MADNESSIQTFIEITQTSREIAERFVNRHNGLALDAIADYFDNGLDDLLNETNNNENNNSDHEEDHNSTDNDISNHSDYSSSVDLFSPPSPPEVELPTINIPVHYQEEEDFNDRPEEKMLDSACLISIKPKNSVHEEKSSTEHNFPRQNKYCKMKMVKIYSNGILLDNQFFSKSDSQNYPIIEKNIQIGRIPQQYLSDDVVDIEIVNLNSETYSP